MVSPRDLSRAMSHALRHEPDAYGLTLDAMGWVRVDDLVGALCDQGQRWEGVDRAAIESMMAAAAKQRFELSGERIRAFYGHSTPERIEREPASPPAVLFHGTSPEAWEIIAAEGLAPMGRQSVHLSASRDIADLVGRRKAAVPLLIVVDAAAAHAAGVAFYEGNDAVWLADAVPATFLRLDVGADADVRRDAERG